VAHDGGRKGDRRRQREGRRGRRGYPIEVKLSDAGGGFALAYPASGSTYTSDAGGGSLVFTEIGAEAVGCVSFEASDGSETVTLSGGAFRAVAF
jgi:hypothetical protein